MTPQKTYLLLEEYRELKNFPAIRAGVIVGALVSTLLMLHSWLVSPPSADRELRDSRKVADKKLKKN